MNNIIGRSKIEWCTHGWNPVVGCFRNCNYCYARKLVTNRLWEKYYNAEIEYQKIKNENRKLSIKSDLKNFYPIFLQHKFWKDFPKKPALIFVNPLSDPEYWGDYYINEILKKTKEYPEHKFLFLSKNSECYNKYNISLNCWIGKTIIKNKDSNNFTKFSRNKIFYSIEPILKKIYLYQLNNNFDWIIVGCQTGNQKNKIIPQKEWIIEIVDFCKQNNIPVFLKDNLKKYCKLWGIKFIQQMPAELQQIKDLWK